MKYQQARLLIWALFLSLSSLSFGESIEGLWTKESGDVVIDVSVTPQGELQGRLVKWKNKSWKTDQKNPNKELRNRSLKGLVVLSGLYKSGEKWEGGTIYDASEGKSYKAFVKSEGENTMVVKGFIGVSLIGKATRWTRN